MRLGELVSAPLGGYMLNNTGLNVPNSELHPASGEVGYQTSFSNGDLANQKEVIGRWISHRKIDANAYRIISMKVIKEAEYPQDGIAEVNFQAYKIPQRLVDEELRIFSETSFELAGR